MDHTQLVRDPSSAESGLAGRSPTSTPNKEVLARHDTKIEVPDIGIGSLYVPGDKLDTEHVDVDLVNSIVKGSKKIRINQDISRGNPTICKTEDGHIAFPDYVVVANVDKSDAYQSELMPHVVLEVVFLRSKKDNKKSVLFRTDQVKMCAPPFQLNPDPLAPNLMANEEAKCKGFFNYKAKLEIFPGEERLMSALPDAANWTVVSSPETNNNRTKYMSRTGWRFGASAELSATPSSKEVGGKGVLSAEYFNQEQAEREIPDFTVMKTDYANKKIEWNFFYTNLQGDNWKDHFELHGLELHVKDIADLGKSTLNLCAEAVYTAPSNSTEKIRWTFRFEPTFMLLRSSPFLSQKQCYTVTIKQSASFTVDMEKMEVIEDSITLNTTIDN